MSYERSDGGSGGIGALEPMAGLYDDCGCGCLFGDDDMPTVPTARTRMQPTGVMVPTARTTPGVVPSAYAQQKAECYWAQKNEAVVQAERARLCATHTPEGVPIIHTAYAAKLCAQARMMEAIAREKRLRQCGQ